ncbi:acyltransferase family protein [Sinomonas terrae]|uniref:Acyltransferase family protein n=1 Tax=Sinomonas terrae TaxID=2908838 RepID=A0ABS9TYC3_9MICC|nr:acyltransferase family protein [Sinomonas terrae]MCH6469350.1 acyltransferase family protein [Sinomonas terrae]
MTFALPATKAHLRRALRSGVLSRHPEPGGDSALRDQSRLDPSANALNVLRLLCAGAVVVSNAWWLGGYGPQPALLGIKLGTAGILGFFAISGYLTTLSAQRASSFRAFAAARISPFYAGLVVAALAVAFLAAPFGALLTGGHYDIRSALEFLGLAFLVLNGVTTTPSIGTSLQGNVDYLDWNGILWTLTWAALCYVIVAGIVFLLRRRSAERLAPMVIALLLGATTVVDSSQIFAKGFEPDRTAFVLPFIAFFLAGSLLAFYCDRVRVEPLPAMLAAALAFAFLITGLGPVLTALPLTYLLLAAGSHRALARIELGRDLSYGIYLYGWPVQQLLAALHLPASLPPLGYAAAGLVAVLPFAFLSSVFVEQPSHRWLRSRPERLKTPMKLAGAR